MYTFTGAPVDVVTVEADYVADSAVPQVGLVAPSGASALDGPEAEPANVKLEESGTYTIVVSDWGSRGTGKYTISVLLNAPELTLARSAASVKYGSACRLTGTLSDDSSPISGTLITLESSTDGNRFSAVQTATTDSLGHFAFTVKPTRKTWYRARSAATDSVGPSRSAPVAVSVGAFVGKPVVPRTVKSRVKYSFYGYLKPRKAVGSYPVKVQAFVLRGDKWRSAGVFKARASNYSTYTKYAVKASLVGKNREQWRLRAYFVGDAQNIATYSGYTKFTMKR